MRSYEEIEEFTEWLKGKIKKERILNRNFAHKLLINALLQYAQYKALYISIYISLFKPFNQFTDPRT